MTIIDHGIWDYYTPATIKAGFPAHALYARRDDGTDWYDYQASKPFRDGSVVMTAHDHGGGQLVIGAATFDYTAIFPPKAVLLEETEYTGDNPQQDFGQRTYNADARKIGDKYVPPPPSPTATETKILTVFDSIVTRLEKLEQTHAETE